MTSARSRRSTWIALAAIATVHVGLVLYYAPPTTMFGSEPVATYDYALHAHQAERALEAFRGFGKLWSYDPFLLAGQPAGAIEDLTSKSLEIFVIVGDAVGAPFATSYNAYILLVHLLVPLLAFAAARGFELTRAQSLGAAALWTLLWFFDSLIHWCWFVGMISWTFAAQLAVVAVALVYRGIEHGRTASYVAAAGVAALLTLVHPFAPLSIALPCLAMYLRAFRRLSAREHSLLWFGAALAASTTLVWIFPALGFRHYIGEAGVFLRPTLESLALDTFDLWKDVLNTGEPVRTVFRTTCFVGAAIVLWRWRRVRDRRVLPLALMVGVTIVLAYAGGYSWTARQTQPYRQLVVAMLAAALPTAVLLSEHLSPARIRALPTPVKATLGLLLLIAAPRVVRTVMHFVPETVPTHRAPARPDDLGIALERINEDVPPKKGYAGPPADFVDVRRWIEEHHRDRGRLLVSNWMLGEYLAGFSGAPVLGGLPQRNVPHVDANLFRVGADHYPNGLEGYLERYAVGFVIMTDEFEPLDFRRDVLEPVVAFGTCRIYRTKRSPSYFEEGEGKLDGQGLNSIRVSGATGPEVVLRFHWMETLRCRPNCEVTRVAIEGDRVGFVGVRSPPWTFEVYNSYDL